MTTEPQSKPEGPTELTIHLAERLWGSIYPDHRPWKEIGSSAQEEWCRFVVHYERVRLDSCAIAYGVDVRQTLLDVVKDPFLTYPPYEKPSSAEPSKEVRLESKPIPDRNGTSHWDDGWLQHPWLYNHPCYDEAPMRLHGMRTCQCCSNFERQCTCEMGSTFYLPEATKEEVKPTVAPLKPNPERRWFESQANMELLVWQGREVFLPKRKSLLSEILRVVAAPIQRHFEELCVWHIRGVSKKSLDVLKPWQLGIASKIEFFCRKFR